MVLLAPEDLVVEGLAELIGRAGFSETGREYKKRGKARLAVVIGERNDPFYGRETLAVALLRGKPKKDWLESVLSKYGRAVLIALDDLDYELEGIAVFGPEWLSETFNRYSIAPPKTLLEKLLPEGEKPEELKEFVLDGPLLESVSPQKLIEEAKKVVSYRFGIRPEALKLEGLTLTLKPVYVVPWVRENGSGKAFYDGENLVLNVEGELKGKAMKALLEDVATVLATEIEVENDVDPVKPVVEEAARRGWLDLRATSPRKAYVPKKAQVTFSAGSKPVEVLFDFAIGRVSAKAEPLSGEELVELAKNHVRAELGEEPVTVEIVSKRRFSLIRGRTSRYLFEIEVNSYSGDVRRFQSALTEDAILNAVLSRYGDGQVIGVERHSGAVVVDILSGGKVLAVHLDQRTGEIISTRDLGSPKEVLKSIAGWALEVVRDIELKSCKVAGHALVRAEFEGSGIRARLEYDGETGKVLESSLEVGANLAAELAVRKYGDYRAIFTEESENGFIITLEGERDIVKVFVSLSGEVRETDRFLKKKRVEEIVLAKILEVEPNPSIECLRLSDHWEVEFTGSKAFGRLKVHRTTGEILEFEHQYIESAITKAFTQFVREKYGDTIEVEWIVHNIEEGYAGVKGVGKKGIYFGKYNTLTGELVDHDLVRGSGISSKFRLAQVESKYAVK